MSAKYLSGITHAIVTVPSKEDSNATGVRACVDICFGPGDETAISQIQLVKGQDGELAWNVPHIPIVRCGRKMMVPVFRGQLLVKLCEAGARAIDHIRRDLGNPEFGKRYRVFAGENNQTKVVEEPLE